MIILLSINISFIVTSVMCWSVSLSVSLSVALRVCNLVVERSHDITTLINVKFIFRNIYIKINL